VPQPLLDCTGVDEQQLMEGTGHRSLDEVITYKRTILCLKRKSFPTIWTVHLEKYHCSSVLLKGL